MSRIRRCLGFGLLAAISSCIVACSSVPGNEKVLQQGETEVAKAPVQSEAVDTPITARTNACAKLSDRDERLVQAMAKRYKKPERLIRQIVTIVNQTVNEGFPSRDQVLALIAVESRFDPDAVYRGSYGLMQIQAHSNRRRLNGRNLKDALTNIHIGIEILTEYYSTLGNKKKTIEAYNMGILPVMKGKHNSSYYALYEKEFKFISSIG
jgi:hypothetical protein